MLFPLALIFLIVSFSCIASHQYEDYQEQFRNRLQKKYSSWDFRETYFFEIPFQPSAYVDNQSLEFKLLSVCLNGNSLRQEERTNLFRTENSALRIDMVDQVPRVILSEQPLYLEWKKTAQQLPAIGKATDLDSMLTAIRTGYWIEQATYTADLPPSAEYDPYGPLEIRVQYNRKRPLNVKSVAISYLKEQHKTGIFFDIYDGQYTGNGPEHFLDPIIPDREKLELFNHKKITQDNFEEWFKVLDDQVYRYPVTKITYKIFPDLDTQKRWMPSQNQGLTYSSFRSTHGQKCYETSQSQFQYAQKKRTDKSKLRLEYQTFIPDENALELLSQVPTKILTNVNNREYFRKETPVLLNSDYLYCDGNGGFFTTRYFKEKWQYTNTGQEAEVYYLSQSIPELQLGTGVTFLGGYGTPKRGFYKVENKESIFETWKLKDGDLNFDFTIDSHNPFKTIPEVLIFSEEEQIKTLQKWDPISSLSITLSGSMITDPGLTLLENISQKITILDFSNIRLDTNVSWNKVFKSLVYLTDLTDLDLSKNRFGHYVNILPDLSNCLKELKKLKVLKIQGQMFSGELLLTFICETIGQLTNLTELHMDHIESSMTSSSPMSPRAKALTLVTLTNKAAETLTNLPHLKSFQAYSNRGRDKIAKNILIRYQARKELQYTLNAFKEYIDKYWDMSELQNIRIRQTEEFIQAGGTLEEVESMIPSDRKVKEVIRRNMRTPNQ